MKTVKYLMLFFVVASLLLIGTGKSEVFAQSNEPAVKFKNVHLWVNPEYDDPRLLVMMEGQLDGVEAPVTVSFLVPTAAQLYSAGSIDADGNYSGGLHSRVASSVAGWDKISYTLTTDTFHIEYYDGIIIGQPDRAISYEFRWLSPISQLAVAIQQPLRSSNFNVTPAGQVGQDYEGFTIYNYTYANLDTQSPLQFEITYTKADNNPSLSTGKSSSTNYLVLAIIVIVVLAVAIAGVLWWRGRSKGNTRAARRQAARVSSRSAPARKQPGERTCPECGEPTDSSKFCPNCGAKL